ncbi:hypothetical protein STEG23_021915 [Scotinomys teguina]
MKRRCRITGGTAWTMAACLCYGYAIIPMIHFIHFPGYGNTAGDTLWKKAMDQEMFREKQNQFCVET